MKKEVEEALAAKERQRVINASRSVAEKFRMLDRLREGSEQLKRAKPIPEATRPEGT